MKSIEKDMHHYILALLLAIFIVSDMSVPKSIEEISHTLLGKVLIIGGGRRSLCISFVILSNKL